MNPFFDAKKEAQVMTKTGSRGGSPLAGVQRGQRSPLRGIA